MDKGCDHIIPSNGYPVRMPGRITEVGEAAVAIERVSTRRQTPGIQDPELIKRVDERGYTLVRTFKLAVSARKGKQQAVLNEILEGARRGEWSVVLCVAIDRVERRGVFALRSWITDLHRAKARLESTSPGEEWLTDFRDELIWSIRLDLEADRARREAELRAERTARGHAEVDRHGSGRVKLPLGWRYRVPKVKYHGEIVPDYEAQEAVREAFRLAAEKYTLQQISRAMGELGYPRTAEQVGAMLRNPVYSTGIMSVPATVEVDPVVTEDQQQRAVAALEARRTYTGPRNRRASGTDYAGRIYCRRHLRPLHRTYGPRHVDGSRTRYYHAKNKDGTSCGCGMFGADGVDELTEILMSVQDRPEYETVVHGPSQAALARIEADMHRLFKDRPDGWTAKLAALDQVKERLAAGETTYERVPTGRDMGDVWKTLDRQGKRRYLEVQAEEGNFRVIFWKRADGTVRGAVRAFGRENDVAE